MVPGEVHFKRDLYMLLEEERKEEKVKGRKTTERRDGEVIVFIQFTPQT